MREGGGIPPFFKTMRKETLYEEISLDGPAIRGQSGRGKGGTRSSLRHRLHSLDRDEEKKNDLMKPDLAANTCNSH